MITAGELRHRVTIQEKAPGPVDSRGQSPVTWSPVADVWAKIDTLAGREVEHARKLYADASLRVTMRFKSAATMTTKNRLLFGTRVLNIGHVDKVDQISDELIVLCSEDKS